MGDGAVVCIAVRCVAVRCGAGRNIARDGGRRAATLREPLPPAAPLAETPLRDVPDGRRGWRARRVESPLRTASESSERTLAARSDADSEEEGSGDAGWTG